MCNCMLRLRLPLEGRVEPPPSNCVPGTDSGRHGPDDATATRARVGDRRAHRTSHGPNPQPSLLVPRQISRPVMAALTWAGLMEWQTIKVPVVAKSAHDGVRGGFLPVDSVRSLLARGETSLACSCRRACWCKV